MNSTNQSIRILNSKLLIPRYADTIKRERLHLSFSEIVEKKVTTVIAGAGYGKTTLMAQACEVLNLDTVWYRLDGSDKDFVTFTHYLIAGIRQHYPKIGKETLNRIQSARILNREHDAVLTILLSEIEKYIDKELIIVLDDYHLIHESSEINKSLNFLLKRLPRFIHIVIISRVDPHIFLSLYRARREVLDIKEVDLAFTIPEIQELYQQVFNIPIPQQSIESLYKKTHGWVSGLILFYHSLKGKTPKEIDVLLQKLKGSHKIIFNYLEENIYDLLPDNIMKFLTKTSILSRVNIDFCNRFLEINDSADTLKYLEDKHLFTWPFDEDRQSYYYHHLFQDFLQKKLYQELGRDAAQKLHLNAAIHWEDLGENEEAMNHYLKANQIDKACEFLSTMGRWKLLKENRLQLINSYLNEIPESHVESNPWVQFTRARVFELSGKPQQAIAAYEKSYALFEAEGSKKGIGKCLKGLAANYYMIGDLCQTEKKLEQVLKQVETIPRFYLDILGYLIFVTSHLGKMSLADKYYKKAVSMPESNEKNLNVWLKVNQGFRYGCSGDFKLALKIGEEILSDSAELGLFQLHTRVYHLISWSCYYLGFFSKGRQYAEKGLQLIDKTGVYDSAQAWLLMSLALNKTALKMLPEAISDGRKSLKIFKDLEIRWGQAYAGHTVQYAYQQSGNLSEAEDYARSALEIIRGLGLPLDEGYIQCGLADLLLEKGQYDEAGTLLKDAEKKLELSKLNRCRTLLQYARYFWERKQFDRALQKLVAGLSISLENDYDIWVINEKSWIIPLLVEAFTKGEMPDYISHIFKKFGLYAVPVIRKLQKNKKSSIKVAVSSLLGNLNDMPSPGLRVYCLGKFRLFRCDEEISADNWSSEKAKMLFKYLELARAKGYQHKDRLMELLWPDEDPEVTANRLHVALTALRKTLEPELERGSLSSYLNRKGDSYLLSLGDDGWSDIEEFKKALQQAKNEKDQDISISHYEKAASLYSGDLFEEDPYCEWCFDAREGLKEKYLDALNEIIAYYGEKGDFHKGIEYATTYLNTDKYDETIYKVLMRFYSHTGNRVMILKTFDNCKKALEEGLDCPPDEETEILYRQLTSP